MRKVSLLMVPGLLMFVTLAFAGTDREEKRDIKEFSSLSLGISADVLIYQGNKTELSIMGDEFTMGHVVTEVKGDRLIIKYDRNTGFWNRYKKLKIVIYSPDYKSISVSGSGDIRSANKIREERMDLSVSGSGSIKIDDLVVSQLETRISGSGSIRLAGPKTAEKLVVSISGSGEVDAGGLETANADVSISGSGDATLNVSKRLEASVSGSGDVEYYGDAIVNARVSGSGDVNKRE